MAARKRSTRRKPGSGSRELEGKESLLLDREAVRYWRLQRGFTQEALAKQRAEIDGETVQISYAHLRRIEKEGRAGPGTARVLAALLGVELGQLRPRDPRALPCGLPREVSVDFVGRRAELAAVLEMLQREGGVRIATSVEGLPGVGKTELVLQVCAVCERSRAFRILWLNAEEPDLTAQWAGVVAQHFGIQHSDERERARLALRKIESSGEPTLIVLDNLERWSASEPWPRPQGRHLRWLVTTRVSQLGDRAFEHVELPVLDEASTRELLTRIAGLEISERPGFAELARHLDGYTIAIELAAAFLGRFPEVEPAEYLKLLTSGKGDLLEDEVRDRTPYQLTLENALDLLWQRLPASVRELWVRAACFAQDPVPPVLSQACGLTRRACAQLRDFHLIQRDPGGWTMHRLVRAFALQRAPEPVLTRARTALVEGSAACYALGRSVAVTYFYVQNRAHLDLALSFAELLQPDLEEARAALYLVIGKARLLLGVSTEATSLLEQAVLYYRARAESVDRERNRLAYAHDQDRFARAQLALVGWRFEPEALSLAVLAAAAAASAFDRQQTPMEWAAAQRNYATAVEVGLNRQGVDLQAAERAVEAHRAALQVYTRDADPLEWARTQSQLCSMLVELCYFTRSIVRAPEAEAAAKCAAEIITRDAFPPEWAHLHHRLSALLILVCDETGEIAAGERAVRLCHQVLEIGGPDEMPRVWLVRQHVLALALLSCAISSSGTQYLEASLQALDAAAEVCDDEHSFLGLLVCLTRAAVLRVLGRRTAGTAALEESVTCGRHAVEAFESGRYGSYVHEAQGVLGAALALWGERLDRTEQVLEGVELCRTAVAASAIAGDTMHAGSRLDLAEALAALSRCSGSSSYLIEAKKCVELAGTVLARNWVRNADWFEQRARELIEPRSEPAPVQR